jgi:hypothetical protein
VVHRKIDACASTAEPLAAENTALDAVSAWLMRYTRFLATKQGLAAALHSGDPAFAALPDYFRSWFEPALTMLLSTAVAAGEIRGDVKAFDLLRGVGNLSVAAGPDGVAHTERMVMLLLDGLRLGAGKKA